jgi:hypothetical protein
MQSVVIEGERMRAIDRGTVEQLKADIVRQGLLQPIGVKSTNGQRGGPYRLLFGAHRLTAMQELHAEDLVSFNIPAVIFPEHMPDWHVQLAEVSENLMRKELSAAERDANTTIYAGLIKNDPNVVSGREKRGASKIGLSGGQTKSTATEKVAADLGIKNTAVHHRVARAAKAAGVENVTVEQTDANTLIDVGKQALAKLADAKANKADDTLPEELSALLGLVSQWETEHGVAAVKTVLQVWWKKSHPLGGIVFKQRK